jgi:hypothetical protein
VGGVGIHCAYRNDSRIPGRHGKQVFVSCAGVGPEGAAARYDGNVHAGLVHGGEKLGKNPIESALMK